MTQIKVGDLVAVRGLTNQVHYNGRRGVVVKLITSHPTTEDLANPRAARHPMMMATSATPATSANSMMASTSQPEPEPPTVRLQPTVRPQPTVTVGWSGTIVPMVWGWGNAEDEAQRRLEFETTWKQRVASMDPSGFSSSKNDVYLYLIQFL